MRVDNLDGEALDLHGCGRLRLRRRRGRRSGLLTLWCMQWLNEGGPGVFGSIRHPGCGLALEGDGLADVLLAL